MPMARRDAPRVVQVVDRAAGAEAAALALIVELHRHADDVVALLGEQRRGDRRIHASRHRDDDPHELSAVPRRRRAGRVRLPQLLDERRQHLDDVIDLGLGGAAAQAEADRAQRAVVGQPIAFSTCDGSSVPDEQAEPDDTAMPSRSSAMSSDSDSTRSKLMLVVFGTRGARGAVHLRAGDARRGCPARGDRAAPRAAAPRAGVLARERGRRADAGDAPGRSRCPRGDCAPGGRR